jgi:hypothetical protein
LSARKTHKARREGAHLCKKVKSASPSGAALRRCI